MGKRHSYEYETPGKPGEWTDASTANAKATLQRRARQVGVLLGIVVALTGFALVADANPTPQDYFLPGLLIIASCAAGWLAYLLVDMAGIVATDTAWKHIGLILRPETYTRQTTPILLQLGILAAIFVVFALNLVRAVRHGDTLSGWTAAVLAAIIFYPMVRYRIERGRWPD